MTPSSVTSKECVDVSLVERLIWRTETSSEQQRRQVSGPRAGRDAPYSQHQPNLEALFLNKFVSYTPSRSGIRVHNLSSTSAAKSTFLLSLSTTKLNKIPRRPPMLVKPLGVSGSTGGMKAANGSTCSKIRMRLSNTYDQKTLSSHKLMHSRLERARNS
jgi:hypothetical protein